MNIRSVGKKAVQIAGAVCLAFSWMGQAALAAGENIRVALFVDTGTGYRGVVPSVTLGSDSGLAIRMTGDKGAALLPVGDVRQARFSLDRFSVIAVETERLVEAQQVAQQLSQQKLDASIQVQPLGGRNMYQVVSGSFRTYEQAINQAEKIGNTTGTAPKISGPYRLEAGAFGTLQEARDWERAFETSGIPAHTVIVLQGESPSYEVWVGDEVSEAKRNELVATASALYPSFSYQKPDNQAYVVLEQDVVADGTEATTIPRYSFSPAAKLIAAPRGGEPPLITVEERAARQYRGMIEMSEYNGHLTVVNELPLEQYLYGVVGSEMETGWPIEALKTQAVLARTRALGQGSKYGVAHLSDTVHEQAYYGYGREADDIRRAVNETAGVVIRYQGELAESLYYSNAGGITADGREVWGSPIPYLGSVESNDIYPMLSANTWYLVQLLDRSIGYVRHDFIDLLPIKNGMGLQLGEVNTDNLNFRTGPSTTYHRSLFTLPAGTQVTIIAQEPEENAFSWTRGPYSAVEITEMINKSQQQNKAEPFSRPIGSLTVTERGPSGRVMSMEADGVRLAVSSPDAHRSVFRQGESGLRSTKFEVEQMGAYTVLGAGGRTSQFPQSSPQLLAVGGNGAGPIPVNGGSEDFLIYDGLNWRVASLTSKFLFRGYGYGHGLGVSQYGAKALAEQGYDYVQILQHYYQNVTIGP
ncbi:SpoIID/LytB domain-containing protein [Brevibacillus humidisoli]|uniref:SpoIID/LytB domain-containing protein n=1 Tax=Brevibacillus humidisoli TaxID=2895522 RepID=UPI001E437D47|nr:SpoIID/LytB domain-containing protein [Brevibacillus humidisoli]UFJ39021.1 SpoIID/LytB domain-containing protein [Brevibacillus humidisoli]